jgi:hypothetical protein
LVLGAAVGLGFGLGFAEAVTPVLGDALALGVGVGVVSGDAPAVAAPSSEGSAALAAALVSTRPDVSFPPPVARVTPAPAVTVSTPRASTALRARTPPLGRAWERA